MALDHHLTSVRFLRGVSPEHIASAAERFRPRVLDNDEVLWEHRAPANSLAIVIDGSLQAHTDLAALSNAGPGDVVGEVTAFFGGRRRSATVRAAKGRVRLLELSADGLQQLRLARNPVYTRLLDEALRAMVARLRRLDARIVAEAYGTRATPSRSSIPTLVRMWRTLVPGGPGGDCPPLHVVLRRRKDLKQVAVPMAAAFKGLAKNRSLGEGEVVFLEGDEADALWLVAAGEVEVLRTQDEESSVLAGTLGPGAFFGMNGLIDGEPRGASCVTSKPTWLIRLDKEDVMNPPMSVQQDWKEAQLITLAGQLRKATLAVDDAQLQLASGKIHGADLDDEIEELFMELGGR
jgi:CRP-like cAMP-binding protein